jgi:hypothetical protein
LQLDDRLSLKRLAVEARLAEPLEALSASAPVAGGGHREDHAYPSLLGLYVRLAVSDPAPTCVDEGIDIVKSHRTGPRGRRGRWTLASILVAGCLIAPAAAARSADHGPGAKDAARANVYVPPSPGTATRQSHRWLNAHGGAHNHSSPDPRTTAKITIPSLPDVVARHTGTPSAADRAYLQTIAPLLARDGW